MFSGLWGLSRADMLVHYPFENTRSDSVNHPSVTASTIDNGVGYNLDSDYSTFTTPVGGGSRSFFARGAGISVSDISTSDAFVTATTQQNYLEFTISSAQQMNLTTMTLDAAVSNLNPHRKRFLFTSDRTGHTYADRLTIVSPGFDGSLQNVLQEEFGSVDIAPAGTNSDWGTAMDTVIDLSGAEFQGINAVTFRLYAFATQVTSPDNRDVIRFDNVAVNGVLIPEPSSLILMMLAGGLLIYLRRTKQSL